jgi:BA14K-like protein
MKNKLRLFAAAAMLALAALTPATAQTVSAITEVQYVEYPAYYAYDGYYYGPRVLDLPGIVIGDAAVAAGGVLGAPYGYYGAPYAEAGEVACARRFRSFNPATGTYTSYTGEQIVCPYLGG